MEGTKENLEKGDQALDQMKKWTGVCLTWSYLGEAMGSEEERVLENQLELQLQEQRDSLSAIDQAILSDPTNPELLAVHQELVQAIKDAEEGLFHLKRARLLQEADAVLHNTNIFTEGEKVELLDPTDVEPEPLEENCHSVGSKCRFRYKDGRWYNGQVVQLDNSVAKVSFLTPTSENMLKKRQMVRARSILFVLGGIDGAVQGCIGRHKSGGVGVRAPRDEGRRTKLDVKLRKCLRTINKDERRDCLNESAEEAKNEVAHPRAQYCSGVGAIMCDDIISMIENKPNVGGVDSIKLELGKRLMQEKLRGLSRKGLFFKCGESELEKREKKVEEVKVLQLSLKSTQEELGLELYTTLKHTVEVGNRDQLVQKRCCKALKLQVQGIELEQNFFDNLRRFGGGIRDGVVICEGIDANMSEKVVKGPNRFAKVYSRRPKQGMCKFFLQQRCRFGSNCRLSHGVDVHLSALKKFVPTIWKQSLVGSSIWAVSTAKAGTWREAELESWDEKAGVGQVVFRDDGSSVKLGAEEMALSEHAEVSDSESDSSLQESESSDYEEDEESQGLGFLESTKQQRGVQTETAKFATWENHTRGIASKMMASMGYIEGKGLGVTGQGMLNPIPVKVLPPKQSLDHALESHKMEENQEKQCKKKRSRGGKRKRDKKFAEANRAAKEEEESTSDVFALINNQLSMHNDAFGGGSMKKQQSKGSEEGKKVDRRALVAYEEEVKDLKMRVEKLEQIVNANKKEKAVYEAAMRKLNETRKALADAEAVHASASNAVVSKEKEKRWLKF
ncbi:unnamed protein product [Sphenostylis stenocarpa]|uniref:Zinc finger CCCH-type with G patch domain-containing protein n=1 Tax=Sphenostylis stenocarpa TaxID=92480 RepID=A0AA86VHG0_9FABA|nr:unnamed protein product [Sphenostylis stenocarpa]